MAVIGIFGGAFCRENEVTAGVTGELGYVLLDDSFIEDVARERGVSSDKLGRSLVGSEPFLNKFTHEREKHIAYLRIALADAIQSDNMVVAGSICLLLPRTIGHALRVCLIANHDFRVREAARITGKSEKDASKLIHEADKRNFACTEYLFGKTAYEESLYDLVIPMQDRSAEDAVREICELARGEPLKTTDRSLRAAKDFALSARVSLALAEAGLAADAHSEDGQVILSINRYVLRLDHYRQRLADVAGKVPGVKNVSARLGPRYEAPSGNPWSKIEGPPRIMLVDDEKEFVHTLSERLKTRNLESSIAYDGEQALEMIEKEEPDVIVLDLMMPGIDGIETLRRVKGKHPKVEVIILTGHGSFEEKQQAEELGAYAYLRKPVEIDTLARVMREAYANAKKNRTSGKTGADDRHSDDE